MSTNKIMLLMSAVLLLVVAGTVQLLGQVTTATLYGKVADSTDAVIPAARVTLLNERTGVSFSQETDAAGGFGFEFIPVGVCRGQNQVPYSHRCCPRCSGRFSQPR